MNSRLQLVLFIVLAFNVPSNGGVEVRMTHFKNCGPEDKTFAFNFTSWPVLTPGERVTVTMTYTPRVDVLYSTYQMKVGRKGRQVVVREAGYICDKEPKFCGLPAGETVTCKKSYKLRTVPPGLKGTFVFSGKLYNQDSFVWLCLESEFVISGS